MISAVVTSLRAQSKLAVMSMFDVPALPAVSQTKRTLNGSAAESVQFWLSGGRGREPVIEGLSLLSRWSWTVS